MLKAPSDDGKELQSGYRPNRGVDIIAALRGNLVSSA